MPSTASQNVYLMETWKQIIFSFRRLKTVSSFVKHFYLDRLTVAPFHFLSNVQSLVDKA